jgi:dihydrodipicolinate synthase/N-acetylneuraminate lyase
MKRYPACVMGTAVIPWDERGMFLEELFVHQVRELLKGTRHVYIFGTAGEGYAVTDRQFAGITRVYNDTMRAEGAEPMVGVVNLSLATIIERIELCRSLGIRRFQISLPSWGALSDGELFVFFREVCGRFRDCEFLHYNLPRTKRLVTPEEYKRLADEHPNLVATKNTADSMDRLFGLQTQAAVLQHFVSEVGYVYASQLGECGLLASLVTLNWTACQAFFDAGSRGEWKKLLALQAEITGLTQALIACAGSEARIDGAYDKMLWRMHDDRFPLRLLPPYAGVSEEAFQKFAGIVARQYRRWLPPGRSA